MAQQSGGNVDLTYVAETAAGTTPTSPSPSMLKLRTTDPGGITRQIEQLESDERYAHRQEEDVRHGFNSVGGQIPAELSYSALDDWIEAALGGTWGDETAGTPETLSIGDNLNTFSVERRNPDISQYEVFRGVNPNTLTLSVQPESIVQATFGVVGIGFDDPAASSLGTPSEVASHSPFDAFSGSMKEGGSSIAIITSMELTLENQRTVEPRIGSKESAGVFNGQAQVTGNVTAYFEDAVLVNKVTQETESSLEVTFQDETGTYEHTINLPRLKYFTQAPDIPESGPVTLNLPFRGLYDGTETTTLKWTRNNPA